MAPKNGLKRYSVFFRDSKLSTLGVRRIVTEPTASELLIGARTTDGSMWLPLLEKAYLDGSGTHNQSYTLFGNKTSNLSRYDVLADGQSIDTVIKPL